MSDSRTCITDFNILKRVMNCSTLKLSKKIKFSTYVPGALIYSNYEECYA